MSVKKHVSVCMFASKIRFPVCGVENCVLMDVV